MLTQQRKQTQVALLHQGLHVINPDPSLHSAAETACKREKKQKKQMKTDLRNACRGQTHR